MLRKLISLEHRDLKKSGPVSIVKDRFLFHTATNPDLYEFEKICACFDDDDEDSCKSIADTTELKNAIFAACDSKEAETYVAKIRSKQQEVSVAGFAPIGEGETVAKTWIQMLANGGKCNSNWKVGTKLPGIESCPDASKKEFPELKSATEEGYIKDFNDLFNPFLQKHIPAIMAAALKDHKELKAIFESHIDTTTTEEPATTTTTEEPATTT